jgi:hypothetical protein
MKTSSQPLVMGEMVIADPSNPRRKPRRVWINSFEVRKEITGRKFPEFTAG